MDIQALKDCLPKLIQEISQYVARDMRQMPAQ